MFPLCTLYTRTCKELPSTFSKISQKISKIFFFFFRCIHGDEILENNKKEGYVDGSFLFYGAKFLIGDTVPEKKDASRGNE